MKRGVSKKNITKVVLVGTAGSGKSTSLETVMDEKPPAEEDRESTPLLKRPVQTEVLYIHNTVNWVKKTPQQKKRYIARLLRARAQRLGKPSTPASDLTSTSVQTTPTSTSVHSTPDQPVASTHQSSIATPPTPTSAAPTATAGRSSNAPPEVTLESLLQSSEVDDEFISLINIPSEDLETILEEVCVYVTDSGGQPEFVEAMTVFLGETSACILVIDLSQALDEHPKIGYYRRGKPVSKPYRCIRTNEENLKQCMRTMHTFTSKRKRRPLAPIASGVPKVPDAQPLKLLFLGTHRDKLHKCVSETVEDKNKRLQKIIPSKFKDQIIWCNPKKLIFEINALNPDATDKITAGKLRQCIMEQCPAMEVEIPLRWDSFNEKLRSIAEGLDRMVMSRDECWQVAESLGLEEESFDGALDFFHSVNLMFYFRDILPKVVFIDPQVILDKVSELIEFMFELREPADQDGLSTAIPPAASDADKQSTASAISPSGTTASTPEKPSPKKRFRNYWQKLVRWRSSEKLYHKKSTVEEVHFHEANPRSTEITPTPSMLDVHPLPPGWQKFNNFGQITKQFLDSKRFSSHYHAGIFTSDDVIHLLKELLVFAKLSTDEGPDTWFMPSVLKQMPEEKMRKVCVSAGPLVVDFPDGGPQNGIFCSLMSHVLSPENRHPYPWKLSLSSNKPKCLYRDCIQFQVPKYPGSVTLFDRYEFFEVHVHTSENKKLELWQHTQNALFEGMETVCEILGYSNNKPRPAIICPFTHKDTTPHPAYIDDKNWTCTCNSNKFGEFKDLKIDYPWHGMTCEFHNVDQLVTPLIPWSVHSLHLIGIPLLSVASLDLGGNVQVHMFTLSP